MRKLLLVAAWVPSAFATLIFCLILLVSSPNVKRPNTFLSYQPRNLLPNDYQLYAALPQVLGSFSSSVEKGDARPEIIRQFLEKHDSPMASHADLLVQVADTHSIDFRLIPAIGMCESNLGKKIPEGSYNAWGFAVYTGKKNGAEFEGWEESIHTMGKYLANRYYKRGLTTPEQMGPIYAPPSVEKGNSWAKCVRSFMDELL